MKLQVSSVYFFCNGTITITILPAIDCVAIIWVLVFSAELHISLVGLTLLYDTYM